MFPQCPKCAHPLAGRSDAATCPARASFFTALLAAAFVMFGAAGCAHVEERRATIPVKIVAINDFHGNLQAPAEGLVSDGRSIPAGGAAYLASWVAKLKAGARHSVFVSAGDLVGGSPLLSSMFDDEPTIEVMNAMGLEFEAAGNHEFDHGLTHLERLQRGGCPNEGCKSGLAFQGARFPMLSANIFVKATGKPLFPAYGVREFEGVKVAFVGVTTREAAVMVPRTVQEALEFRDEADAVNGLVPELRRAGIEAIVLLMHEGGSASGGANACDNPQGAMLGIVPRLDPAVDVVVSAHTHNAYVCRLGGPLSGRLVTSAGNYGRLVTEIDLDLDRDSRDVVSARALNRMVDHDIDPDRNETERVGRYAGLASAVLDRGVGRTMEEIPHIPTSGGETAIGRLVADAHRAETAASGAQIAFVNAGGVRSALPYRADGRITFGDVHAVYPFENTLVTMNLSGAQIVSVLEQQWRPSGREILQVSRGFSYSWRPDRPIGQRVVPGSVAIDGRSLEPGASYRVTVNSFLEAGGDGFSVFKGGRDRVAGPDGREALLRYIAGHSPVSPAKDARIRRVEEP